MRISDWSSDVCSSDLKKKSEHKDRQVAETGIVVVGRDAQGRGYVLEDLSFQGSPEEWGRQAVIAFDEWEADMIVYEANQGGEMVAAVQTGRASCRERGCQYVEISVGAVSLKKK